MRLYKPTTWGVAIYNHKTGEQTGAAVGVGLEVALGRKLTALQRLSLAWNGWLLA